MDPILERRLRRRPDLAFRAMEGEAFILSVRDQRLHRLNESGAFLWAELEREPTVGELAAALSRAFEVEAQRAQDDAVAFARHLLANGLVELAGAPGASPAEAARGRT